MIVDSSVLVSVILNEPDAVACSEKLASATSLHISAVTLVETSMVLLSRAGPGKVEALDALMNALGIVVGPVNQAQALLARDAFSRFGKGRHQARLNLGDCFVYALARHYDQPLLFIGDDFAQTDLATA